LLLPQLAARADRRRNQGLPLRLAAWVAFSGFAFLEYGNSFRAAVVAAILTGVVLLWPAFDGWGIRLRRETWCRAGFAVFVLYMGAQGVAHHLAMNRVERFAISHNLRVEHMGALPTAPSLAAWTGLIRTPDGVYYAPITFPGSAEPEFQFAGDSPANGYIEAAKHAPAAKQFLWFTRFPVISYAQVGKLHRVEFHDYRFSQRPGRRSHFAVSVTMDDNGKVVDQQWPEH
jgi:hypothetical protein